MGMPTFFSFEQDSESRSRFPATEASPSLGCFRAVPSDNPQSRRRGSLGLLTRSSWCNSVRIGHAHSALLAAGVAAGLAGDSSSGSDEDEDDEDEDEDENEARWARWVRRRWKRDVEDMWITPKQAAARRVANSWWRRSLALVVLPTALAVDWCAGPFLQYPLGDDEEWDGHRGGAPRKKTPGHRRGESLGGLLVLPRRALRLPQPHRAPLDHEGVQPL